MAKLQKLKEAKFPTRAEATVWAKEEKQKLRQQNLSVKYNIDYENKTDQWRAELLVGGV